MLWFIIALFVIIALLEPKKHTLCAVRSPSVFRSFPSLCSLPKVIQMSFSAAVSTTLLLRLCTFHTKSETLMAIQESMEKGWLKLRSNEERKKIQALHRDEQSKGCLMGVGEETQLLC